MNSPTISVVIPSHNSAPFLGECIDSVLAQTYPVHEIIVVDDGSTDDTVAVLNRFGRQVNIISQPKRGVSAARNVGINRARGEWIAFLDSDDVWRPDKLAKQIAMASADDSCMCVHTWLYYFGDCNTGPVMPQCLRDGGYANVETLILRDLIWPSTALVRRTCPVRYREWADIGEDNLYFAEMSRLGNILCVPEPLVGYRRHPGSVMYRPDSYFRGAVCQLRWVKEQDMPEDRARPIKTGILQKILPEMLARKWSRTWDEYWKLRTWLKANWDVDQRPGCLAEVIYPRFFYTAKDSIDRLIAWFQRRRERVHESH